MNKFKLKKEIKATFTHLQQEVEYLRHSINHHQHSVLVASKLVIHVFNTTISFYSPCNISEYGINSFSTITKQNK